MVAGFLLNDIVAFDCPVLIEERGARPSDPAPSPGKPPAPELMPKPREGVADVLSPAKRPPPAPAPPLAMPEPGVVRRAAFFILHNTCIDTKINGTCTVSVVHHCIGTAPQSSVH